MMNSLQGKLIVFMVAIYAVSALIFLVFSRHTFEIYQQEIIQKYYRELAARLVSRSMSSNGPNLQTLFEDCLEIKGLNKELDFYLLDANGGIFNSTTAVGAQQLHKLSLAPIREFLGDTPILPIRAEDPTDPPRKVVFSAAVLGTPAHGYLYIVLSSTDYEISLNMARNSYTLHTSLLFGLGGLLLALATGFMAFVFTTRRIVALSKNMDAFRQQVVPASGNPRAEIRQGDEIQHLEDAFDDLRRRIGEQLLAIQQADDDRKDLIANVSHDLRTPIATLQGYLETILLRGPGMDAQERRNHLEIVFRQCERLSKLIADLFELSKLDSRHPNLCFESFSIAELVQDIAQKFNLKATQQNVQLNTVFAFDISMVVGDIRLIERVLENMIENALRHTPAGGHITLRLTVMETGIRVEVEDSGSGIAPDQFAQIFDRYYRATSGRGDGAGLGLAIARRAVELHGGQIEVSSQPGHGATFAFTLPYRKTQPMMLLSR